MKLKGHTKIELTDVNTGEVQVIEDDNMITNGLECMLQSMGIWVNNIEHQRYWMSNDSNDNNLKFFKNYFGGLLMFDKHQPENFDNIAPAGGTHMTGHGSFREYLGEDSTMGTYNKVDSGPVYDGYGYKQVWDFATSQGNGDISSICLTTALGGTLGCGHFPYSTDIYPNWDNNYEYRFRSAYSFWSSRENNSEHLRTPILCTEDKMIMYSCNTTDEKVIYPHNGPSYNNYINNETNIFNSHTLIFDVFDFPLNQISIFNMGGMEKESYISQNRNSEISIYLKELKDLVPEEVDNNYKFQYQFFPKDNKSIYFFLGIYPTHTNHIVSVMPQENIGYIWEIDFEKKEAINFYTLTNNLEMPVCIACHSNIYDNISERPHNGPGNTRNTGSYWITKEGQFIGQAGTSTVGYRFFIQNIKNSYNLPTYVYQENAINNIISNKTYISQFLGIYEINNKLYFRNYSNGYGIYVECIDLINKSHGFLNIKEEQWHQYIVTSDHAWKNWEVAKIIPVRNNLFCSALLQHPSQSSQGIDINLFLFPLTLMTINNLPQTLTKTESQTMKVTYTLVDEEYANKYLTTT